MQVRVRSENNAMYILTKGAPEIMSTLYKNVPKGYEYEQQKYTSKGRRVLSLGYKALPAGTDLEEENRFVLESNLICCGLLVLDSPLKPQSKPAISQLIQSSHRVVVITGDNPLTACSVASQVGILSRPRTLQLILKKDLLWYPVGGSSGRSGSSTIPFAGDAVHSETSKLHLVELASKYELCVTGGALIALANKYGNKNDSTNYDHQVSHSFDEFPSYFFLIF